MLKYNPINEHFEGAQFHHLHIMNNHALGLYIPRRLHRSISHNFKTGKGLREINKAALLWLCDQSEIRGMPFDPIMGLPENNIRGIMIEMSTETHKRLGRVGRKNEKYGDVVKRLLDTVEESQRELSIKDVEIQHLKEELAMV